MANVRWTLDSGNMLLMQPQVIKNAYPISRINYHGNDCSQWETIDASISMSVYFLMDTWEISIAR